MKTNKHQIIKAAPGGLGFGVGSISVKERLADSTDALSVETMTVVDELITKGEILVPISRDERGQLITDDGCGDGRSVNQIMRGNETLKKSLNRAKVFGGGLTMGMVARIGLGKASTSLKEIYSFEAAQFKHFGIDYGAHIDENFGEKSSGCSAIDKALQNIVNATEYKDQISRTIKAIDQYIFKGEDSQRLDKTLDEVFKNYKDYYDEFHGQNYVGSEIIELATKDHKVVKKLDSKQGHREVAIVLNLTTDTTINQQLVRDKTNNIAQVFAVDVPRLIKIVNRRYEDKNNRKAALVSMLVYTLSTAVTLTDGSLPVYLVISAN